MTATFQGFQRYKVFSPYCHPHPRILPRVDDAHKKKNPVLHQNLTSTKIDSNSVNTAPICVISAPK
jgi:hypothetical protein